MTTLGTQAAVKVEQIEVWASKVVVGLDRQPPPKTHSPSLLGARRWIIVGDRVELEAGRGGINIGFAILIHKIVTLRLKVHHLHVCGLHHHQEGGDRGEEEGWGNGDGLEEGEKG